MTMATIIKENISLGMDYSLRDLVHCYHGGKNDSTQAEMVLEKELRSCSAGCRRGLSFILGKA